MSAPATSPSQSPLSTHSELSDGNDKDHSELYKTARRGNLSAVKDLVQQLQDQHVSTQSLQYNLDDGLRAACTYKHRDIIVYLLESGAVLDPWHIAEVIDENTPTSMFEILLNYGWDVNEPLGPLRLFSPPLRAVISNANLVRWLLDHGADPNKPGFRGVLPIELACSQTPEIVDLLLAAGASLHSDCLHLAAKYSTEDEEFQPQSLSILSHLLDLGMDINGMSDMDLPSGRGHGFFTPLHAAVMADSPEVILFLLKRGANQNIRSTIGETPLAKAIRDDCKASVGALSQGLRRSARLSGAQTRIEG